MGSIRPGGLCRVRARGLGQWVFGRGSDAHRLLSRGEKQQSSEASNGSTQKSKSLKKETLKEQDALIAPHLIRSAHSGLATSSLRVATGSL